MLNRQPSKLLTRLYFPVVQLQKQPKHEQRIKNGRQIVTSYFVSARNGKKSYWIKKHLRKIKGQ